MFGPYFCKCFLWILWHEYLTYSSSAWPFSGRCSPWTSRWSWTGSQCPYWENRRIWRPFRRLLPNGQQGINLWILVFGRNLCRGTEVWASPTCRSSQFCCRPWVLWRSFSWKCCPVPKIGHSVSSLTRLLVCADIWASCLCEFRSTYQSGLRKWASPAVPWSSSKTYPWKDWNQIDSWCCCSSVEICLLSLQFVQLLPASRCAWGPTCSSLFIFPFE